jgi:hypothetical protein
MHEITGATAVDHHFVDGTSTQNGTVVTADFLNTLQDEICNLITSVGIPLNTKENDDKKQLIAAVTKHIANALISYVTQTELKNLASNLTTKTDFAALEARVSWCEEEIHSIIGKVAKL